MLWIKVSYSQVYISPKLFSKLIYVRKWICLKWYSLTVTDGIREIRKIDQVHDDMSEIYMDILKISFNLILCPQVSCLSIIPDKVAKYAYSFFHFYFHCESGKILF